MRRNRCDRRERIGGSIRLEGAARLDGQRAAAADDPRLVFTFPVELPADTDDEARRLATSLQQQFVALQRGRPVQLQPPVDRMDGLWSPLERASVKHTLRQAIIGGPDTVQRRIEELVARTGADELMFTSHLYDHEARLRSYEIVAGIGVVAV